MAKDITVIVLAAGQGKRMRSDLPKVLHPLAGRPLLAHVLGSAEALRAREMRVVYGHGGEQVRQVFAGRPVKWIHQAQQRGTGHAVRQAMPGIRPGDVVLVLYGDVPLVLPETATGGRTDEAHVSHEGDHADSAALADRVARGAPPSIARSNRRPARGGRSGGGGRGAAAVPAVSPAALRAR